jgi:4-hydroxybenzoate polyprenyltransferase
MVDLPADRHHPQKRLRPFAAGELSLFWGLASVPLLLTLSLFIGLLLPWPFLGMLVIYFLLNLGYSFTLKRAVLLDVIVLAGLYTMRIMAGAASIDTWPSSWLLAFNILVPEPCSGETLCGTGNHECLARETVQVRGTRV